MPSNSYLEPSTEAHHLARQLLDEVADETLSPRANPDTKLAVAQLASQVAIADQLNQLSDALSEIRTFLSQWDKHGLDVRQRAV